MADLARRLGVGRGSKPINSGPPYTYFEINRATNSAFGVGPTPQRDVAVTGTFGYDLNTAPAGALGAAVIDTTTGAVAVTNGAGAGIGDVVLIGTERMLLADKTLVSTGQVGTIGASTADQALPVSNGTLFYVGETVVLDAESMLVTGVAGNNLLVRRGWDGTVATVHTGATIYAPRSWTVTRAAFGTTAATHLVGSAIARYAPPSLVAQLSLAEAENNLLQAVSGYARTVGAADNARPVSGQSLADIRTQAYAQYGRKGRRRTV